MSLRRKFTLLLILVGVVMGANLATIAWAVVFLERELAVPLSSFQEVLTGLSRVKRALGDIHRGLSGPEADIETGLVEPEVRSGPERGPEALARFERRASVVAGALADLESRPGYELRVGRTTGPNLRRRIEEALRGAREWYAADNPPPARRAAEAFHALHELIERIERENLENLGSAVSYSARIRWTVLGILAASTLTVALAAWDAAVFIRRWSLTPVARLRLAAERLAAGDFSHRIEITGRDEIGQLSAEVNHMAATIAQMQAERIERERLAAVGEVVRRIAHNLRNPLAGIRSLAEYARGDLPPESELRENQTRIIQTVDRFERWLADLLSATRPLDITPQNHEIAPWLAGVVETHRPGAAARGVTLAVDTTGAPPAACFDPRHLEQALVALVSNAIEASPPGGVVTIVAGTDEPLSNGAAWRISITDQGPGVPDELREAIFRPYFTTKRQGTGIGLAVAQQVVVKHGGRITVTTPSQGGESAAGPPGMGPGAGFTVVLPLAGPAEGGQMGPKGAIGGENSGHRG